jgi:Uncharacterised nucleotidyltransferase
VLGRLETNGVTALVFKGAEYLARHFGTGSVGALQDVDIIVRPGDQAAASEVLRELGFRQATVDYRAGALVDHSPEVIAAFERDHYELAAFVRLHEVRCDPDELDAMPSSPQPPIWRVGDTCMMAVMVDVHRGVAKNIDGARFFEHAVRSALGTGRTFCAADHLWFTTSRYYTEVAMHGKKSLRDFVYLVALLRTEDVDWDLVLHANEELRLGPSLYYYLRFLAALTGVEVPSAVLKATSPATGRYRRDWGWQLSRLFGQIDPFPLRLPDPSRSTLSVATASGTGS